MRKYTIVVAFLSGVIVFLALVTTRMIEEYLTLSQVLPKAEVIVVLAGGSEYEERNRAAARYFLKGGAKRILLTDDGIQDGWNKELNRNPFFVERAKWLLVDAGVPETAIDVVGKIPFGGTRWFEQGTESEAKLVREFLDTNRIRSVQLVTSDYHTRRVFRIFQATNSGERPAIAFGITYPEKDEEPRQNRWVPINNRPTKLWIEFFKLLLA